MKNFITLFGLVASLHAFAMSPLKACFGEEPCVPVPPLAESTAVTGYNLAVHTDGQDKSNFFLSFSTRETHPQMCTLSVDEITLTNKDGNPVAGRNLEIHITTHLDASQACLAADGPHTGAVRLNRGYMLPALIDGRYMVFINGEWMGALDLAGDKISAQ